jgi:hypothetical protein
MCEKHNVSKSTQRVKPSHADRLAALMVLSQTYAVSESSITDLIGSLLQNLT